MFKIIFTIPPLSALQSKIHQYILLLGVEDIIERNGNFPLITIQMSKSSSISLTDCSLSPRGSLTRNTVLQMELFAKIRNGRDVINDRSKRKHRKMRMTFT